MLPHDMTADPDCERQLRWNSLQVAGRITALIGLGLIAWIGLWSITSPRAGYDTLWYERFGLRYAGASADEQIAGSWAVFAAYADPAIVPRYADAWPWKGENDSTRSRWVGLYAMRPAFPLLVAAARPVAGNAGALAPSVVAVVIFTVAVGLSAPRLIGLVGTGLLLLISFANPFFGAWLVYLTTDGLGVALWAAMLLGAARFVESGARRWLVMLFAVTLVAAFNRQTGVVLIPSLAVLALITSMLRKPVWRRLAVAAVVASIPVGLFAVYATVAGLPSFIDMLQDAPTRHFADPDIAHLPRYLLGKFREQAPVLMSRLLAEPHLWIPLTFGVVGLVLSRTWLGWLCLTSLVFLPVLHFVHPILTEANRTLAPGWFNVHVGLVLLLSRSIATLVQGAVRQGRSKVEATTGIEPV
jgi:hypothetical protein